MTETGARLPLSAIRTNFPYDPTFSFHASSPSSAVRPSFESSQSCVYGPIERTLDEDDRIQSDRPLKRARDAGRSPSQEERAQFIDGWEQHLSQNAYRSSDYDHLRAQWGGYRQRSPSASVTSLSPSSGLFTPPLSPHKLDNHDTWNEIPPGIQPGDSFYLGDSFEIQTRDDGAIPLVLGRSDIIGPHFLPISYGTPGSKSGAFFYDPSLVHIQLSVSDNVDEVDVFHEREKEGLFVYLGRFAAIQSSDRFMDQQHFDQLNFEEQLSQVQIIYERQPAGRRMSKQFILHNLIHDGNWFPLVELVPSICPAQADKFISEKEYFDQRETRMAAAVTSIRSEPTAKASHDDDNANGEGEPSAPPFSPLSVISFGSEIGEGEDSLGASISAFLSYLPDSTEDPTSTLFDNPHRSCSPLPEDIQERPLTRIGFDPWECSDEEELGFPDSPEQTYSSRLRRQPVYRPSSMDHSIKGQIGLDQTDLPTQLLASCGLKFPGESRRIGVQEDRPPRRIDSLASELNLGHELSCLSGQRVDEGESDEDDGDLFDQECGRPPGC